jgi:hypothetical protein
LTRITRVIVGSVVAGIGGLALLVGAILTVSTTENPRGVEITPAARWTLGALTLSGAASLAFGTWLIVKHAGRR